MLDVRDVSVVPPGAREPILTHLTFRIAPGEWLAITGPNGCGKSSLALTLAGLAEPGSGAVTWAGRSVSGRGVNPPEAVLLVMQDPESQLLQPTVREELALTALNLGQDPQAARARALRVAHELGIERWLDLDPHTLSAGVQQQVLLGAALAAQPAALVVDEPCAHLDTDLRGRALKAIEARVAAGMAVAYITQDEGERLMARRTLSLGGPLGAAPAPPARPIEPAEPAGLVPHTTRPDPAAYRSTPAMASDTLLRIHVVPPTEVSGPQVRVSNALEIVIPVTGLTALTGPNGAGKSVLLGAVCGVLELPQVAMEWRRDGLPPPLLVGEQPSLQIFEELVRDELRFAAVSRGRPQREVDRAASGLLGRLGLDPDDFMARRTWHLSSGEKRLIQTVAGLLAPAALLALDEPSAGLDAWRREALGELIFERSLDSSVLIASQDHLWLDRLRCTPIQIGLSQAGNTPSPSKKTD